MVVIGLANGLVLAEPTTTRYAPGKVAYSAGSKV